MKQFFDYAGNEIKEGQEIVIVKILDRNPSWGFIIPNGKSFMSAELPDKECWEIGEPIKIIVSKETMYELGYHYILTEGEYTIECFDTLDLWMWDINKRTTILAVKGISDNKEYYELWKKKNNSPAKEITT